MHGVKRSIFLGAVFCSFVFQSQATRLANDGLTFDGNDLIGLVSGGAVGGATFGLLKLIDHQGYMPDSWDNKILYVGLIAAGVGVATGVVIDIILSIRKSKRLKNHGNILSVCEEYDIVSHTVYVTSHTSYTMFHFRHHTVKIVFNSVECTNNLLVIFVFM